MNNLNLDFRTVKLYDLAILERAKEGQVYPAGSTLVQVSATNGQTIYLEEATTVETKYVVVIPKVKIMPFYLHLIVEMAMPSFLHSYKSGLNLQVGSFGFMYVNYHTDLNTQLKIANDVRMMEDIAYKEQVSIESLKDIKGNMLNEMFV